MNPGTIDINLATMLADDIGLCIIAALACAFALASFLRALGG